MHRNMWLSSNCVCEVQRKRDFYRRGKHNHLLEERKKRQEVEFQWMRQKPEQHLHIRFSVFYNL